jgi:transposase InsO family protein
VDLAAVLIVGFWVPWLPFALPQIWLLCWWIAVTIDHFSRRAMGVAIFTRPLPSGQVTAFLRRPIRKACATPKYLICDRGPQFWCDGCKHHGIRPRFGAVGQHGSIAVVERFIRSLKEEGPRRTLISLWQRTSFNSPNCGSRAKVSCASGR